MKEHIEYIYGTFEIAEQETEPEYAGFTELELRLIKEATHEIGIVMDLDGPGYVIGFEFKGERFSITPVMIRL